MIYLITNKINNNSYIGKTTQTTDLRWYRHRKAAEYGSNTHLHKAIRKYGVDSFVIEFLSEGLDDEEVQLISLMCPEYNMTAGGEGGDTSNSPNYVAAMQLRNTSGVNNPNYGKRGKNSPNYGKVRTEEQKQRHRDGYTGKRIAVIINGVQYESVSRAAKLLGRSERYVRLHDELNEWSY